MRALRVIETGMATARWNTGASLAMLESFERDQSAGILRFYHFQKCVLLGRSQEANDCIDLDYCRRNRIDVARRITGGGAVFMSPSMLAWDFVVPAARAHDRISTAIGTAVIDALASFHVRATFRSPSDILVDERKVSGAASTTQGRAFLHQGTLLLKDDTPEMSATLRIPTARLRNFVTSLAECGLEGATAGELIKAIAKSLAEAFDFSPRPSSMSQSETSIASRDFSDEIGWDIPPWDAAPLTERHA